LCRRWRLTAQGVGQVACQFRTGNHGASHNQCSDTEEAQHGLSGGQQTACRNALRGNPRGGLASPQAGAIKQPIESIVHSELP